MRLVVCLLSVVALAFAGSAAADAPVTEQFVDVFDDVNPCTGEVATITFVGTAYIHEHGSREIFRAQRTISTSDGFSGRGTDTGVVNGQVFKFTLNDMITNAAGDRVRVHIVVVGDIATDTVRVERVELTCVGGK